MYMFVTEKNEPNTLNKSSYNMLLIKYSPHLLPLVKENLKKAQNTENNILQLLTQFFHFFVIR